MYRINSASIDNLEISESLIASQSSIIDLHLASYVSGTFQGEGSGITGVVASATPAGQDRSVQFNDGGTTSGSGNFQFDKSSNDVNITGSVTVQGTVSASSYSGDGTALTGIVDSAETSSMLEPYFLSQNTSSFVTNAATASHVLNSYTSSFVLNSFTASMLEPYLLESETSSFTPNDATSSLVRNNITSSMLEPYLLSQNTSSFTPNDATSSHVLNSYTSSFTLNSFTASMLEPYLLSEDTASFVPNANTASHVLNSYTSSFVLNSFTSSMLESYLLESETSSFTPNNATSSLVRNDITASMLEPYFLSANTSSIESKWTGSGGTGIERDGNVNVTGSVSASSFIGDGSSLTGLSSTTIATGSVTASVDIGSVDVFAVSSGSRNLFVIDTDSRGVFDVEAGTDANIIFGSASFANYDSIIDKKNVVIGNEAMGKKASTSTGSVVDSNVVIGYQAGNYLGKVNGGNVRNNVCVGTEAGDNILGGIENVFVGFRAGAGDTSTNMSYNICIGGTAGEGLRNGSFGNIMIGWRSGWSLTGGGDYNTFIGDNAGNAWSNGSYNVLIGKSTGADFDGQSNTIVISDGEGNVRFFVTGSTGYVGINTTTPTYQLDVSGSIGIDGVRHEQFSVSNVNSGSNELFSITTGSFTSAFVKYTIASESNARSGEMMSVWNGTTLNYTETNTTDIGTTTEVTTSMFITGSSISLEFFTPEDGWTIKTINQFM